MDDKKYFEIYYHNGDKKLGMIFDTDLYLEKVDFEFLCYMIRKHVIIPAEIKKMK